MGGAPGPASSYSAQDCQPCPRAHGVRSAHPSWALPEEDSKTRIPVKVDVWESGAAHGEVVQGREGSW